jgi:hypothetical protein
MTTSHSEAFSRKIFYILLAQIVFLFVWAALADTNVVLVHHISYARDFVDFYRAARDAYHGTNPYIHPRFNKPPPVILLMMPFAKLPIAVSAALFFAINLLTVPLSVRYLSKGLGLSKSCTENLIWITFLFYPFYFLLDRGNLDGLVLGCLCWAFCSERSYLRTALVAVAAGIKIYPLLLIAPALRNKLWFFSISLAVLTASLFLVTPQYLTSFIHATEFRALHWEPLPEQLENISPGAIFVVCLGKHTGKLAFYLFWSATLTTMLYKQRSTDVKDLILPFLAWMVSFPQLVLVYTGILLLPVLAWKMYEMGDSEPNLSDKIFMLGFLLVGQQANAFSTYFGGEAASGVYKPIAHPIFQWLSSIGMCLVLASMAIHRKSIPERTETPENVAHQLP